MEPPDPEGTTILSETQSDEELLGLDLAELILNKEEEDISDQEESTESLGRPKSFREIYEEVKGQQQLQSSQAGQLRQLAVTPAAVAGEHQYNANLYLDNRDKIRPEMGLYDSMLSLNTVIEVERRSPEAAGSSAEEEETDQNGDVSSSISDSESDGCGKARTSSAAPEDLIADEDHVLRPSGLVDAVNDKENAGGDNNKRTVAAASATRLRGEERRGPVLTNIDLNLSSRTTCHVGYKESGGPSSTREKELHACQEDSQVGYYQQIFG
jgi:hypothetical protein